MSRKVARRRRFADRRHVVAPHPGHRFLDDIGSHRIEKHPTSESQHAIVFLYDNPFVTVLKDVADPNVGMD